MILGLNDWYLFVLGVKYEVSIFKKIFWNIFDSDIIVEKLS